MQLILISRTFLAVLLWSSVIVVLSAQPQIQVTSKGQIEHVNTGGSVFIGQDAGDLDDLSTNNNVFVGFYSGAANTTGSWQCAVGHSALKFNTVGYQNSAFGYRALCLNTTGHNNTSMGYLSLESNNGIANSAYGSQALRFNTSGVSNTAVGSGAMVSNTTGGSNTAIGTNALAENISGDLNTAIGTESMVNNSSGTFNVAVGHGSLHSNTTGGGNTAVGKSAAGSCEVVSGVAAFGTYALGANTSGTANSAFGYYSMRLNTSGHKNTAMGYNALRNNTLASSNTAVGNEALASNTNASSNTAVGDSALFTNSTGGQNTAFGAGALQSAIAANNNTAIGFKALTENTAGINNIAIGSFTLQNGNVSFCTAIGNHSGKSDMLGSQYNVYIGHYAGSKASGSTVKSNNVMIGHESGSGNEGNGNIFIGYQSGKNETGSNKLYIENSNSATPLIFGDFATERVGIGNATPEDALSVRSTATDNALRVQVGGATKMRIFNNGSISFGSNNAGVSDDDVYVHNQLGLGVSAPTHRIELPNNGANDLGKGLGTEWKVYSDQRVKKNVRSLAYGIETIRQLRPVQYEHCSSDFKEGRLVVDEDDFTHQIGFLAQEVAQAVAEAVSIPEDESSALWTMSYDKLIPVVVKAMQEQQDIIDELRAREKVYQAALESVEKRLAMIEVNMVSKD